LQDDDDNTTLASNNDSPPKLPIEATMTLATAPPSTPVKDSAPPGTPVKDSAPPSTPVKDSSKKARDHPGPNEKSPDRYKNGNYCYGCDHVDVKNVVPTEPSFVPLEAHFFTKECLKKRENFPQDCLDCKGSFFKGRKNSLKLRNDGASVWVCRNAYNHEDHPCLVAICPGCAQKRVERAKLKFVEAKINARGGMSDDLGMRVSMRKRTVPKMLRKDLEEANTPVPNKKRKSSTVSKKKRKSST